MSGWTTTSSSPALFSSTCTFKRLEQFIIVLIPISTCLLAWGRYNVLTVIFFASLAFLITKQVIVLFVKNEGLQKRMSIMVSMFAPAVSPMVNFTCRFISNKDSSTRPVPKTFCQTSPQISNEIETLVQMIIRDYILFWFRVVSPDDEDFVRECRLTFQNMFTIFVKEKLLKVRADRLIPQALAVIRDHVQAGSEISSIIESEESVTAMERIMHSAADYLLASCAPHVLNRMNDPDLSDPTSGQVRRNSVFMMVKEMLVFGVLMPIASHLSQPELIFSSIIGLVSETGEGKIRKPDSELMMSSARHDLPEKKWSEGSERTSDQFSDPLSNPRSSFDADLKSPGDSHVREYADLSSHGTRVSLDADTGLEKGLEVSEEADQRLFLGIRVSDTRISGMKGDYFVEYRVTYDGLFEMMEEVASSSKTTSVSCLVRQEVSVWRRFSEFVSLHQKLEGNHMLRPYLRRIENPIRLKTVTSIFGSKLARSVTIQRSMFLVRYMNKLADIPIIANSPPFRLFLAYDSDAASKSIKSSTSKSVLKSLVPSGLDKVISESIRGAVTIMKTVIPIDSYQDGYFAFFSSPSVRAKIDTKFGSDLPVSLSLDPQVVGRLAQNDTSTFHRNESHLSTSCSINSSCDQHTAVQISSKDQNITRNGRESSPLRTVDILVQMFELIRSEGKSSTESIPLYILKCLFGDLLETILQQVVNFHFNEETFVFLLHSLHQSIWPAQPEDQKDEEASAERATQVILKWIKSKQLVYRFLPLDLEEFISFAMNNLRHQQKNQILINELISAALVHLRDDC